MALSLSELFVSWYRPQWGGANYYKIHKSMLNGGFCITTDGYDNTYMVADYSESYYPPNYLSFWRNGYDYHDKFWLYNQRIKGHWSWTGTKCLHVEPLYGEHNDYPSPDYIAVREWTWSKGLQASDPDTENIYNIYNLNDWETANILTAYKDWDYNSAGGVKVDSTYYIACEIIKTHSSNDYSWIGITKTISNGSFTKIANIWERDEIAKPRMDSNVIHYRNPTVSGVVCSDSTTSGSLSPSTTYYVKVHAKIDDSNWSTAGDGNHTLGSGKTALDVSWDSYSGATRYYIYMQDAQGFYRYYTSTTGTNYTITAQPAGDFAPGSGEYDDWTIHFAGDNISWYDGQIIGLRYQVATDIDFNNLISDTTHDTNNFSYFYYFNLTSGSRYTRCKYKWSNGDWGDWTDTITMTYDGSADSKDLVVSGNKRTRYFDDILYYDSYVYVLVHYSDEGTGDGIEIYKINPSDLSITATYSIDSLDLKRVRLQKDDNNLYLIYIANTQGYTSHLYYRKQSESFNTDHEISLPDGFEAFKDACLMQVNAKSYIIINAYYITESYYSRGRFLVHDVSANTTTIYNETHPFYDGWLEKDPEEQGIWYEENGDDDKAEMQQIRYLTLSEPISKNYTLPIWGRIDRR